MSDWTCDKVEGWIDLYAAGEADSPTRAAVGRHLKACPACVELHQQAVQLIGLLDQHEQESKRLERLWSRLEAAPKPALRPMRLQLWRAAAALAASVLLLVGLSGWFGPGTAPVPIAPQLTAVLNPLPERSHPGGFEAMMAPGAVAAKEADDARPGRQETGEPVYPATPLPPGGAVGPPPAVELVLELQNLDREVLPIHFNDEKTQLIMDLHGPGVRDVPAPGAAPLAELDDVRIAPGATYKLTIQKLAYGRPGDVHYLYWTEPGEYTLTITLRARVQPDPPGEARGIVVRYGPIKVRVR